VTDKVKRTDEPEGVAVKENPARASLVLALIDPGYSW
jgi:hypothetical protein